jgi:hypothetical protein
MDSKRIKEVIDLHEYISQIGSDRPNVAVFLKELGITPQTMQDAVIQTAMASSVAIPDAAFHICNHLFKLGLTIGYKVGVKRSMEKEFGMGSNDERTN